MLNPMEVTKLINDKAIKFVNKSNKELMIGGILAGSFVGLAAMTTLNVCADMKGIFGEGFTKLISGIVFSLGMILIVLSGSELFTGSCLFVTSIFDNKKNTINLIKNWGIVFAANFVGVLIVCVAVLLSGLLKGVNVNNYLTSIVNAKLNLTFLQALIRGVLCNYMVCLAVRVGDASNDVMGKIGGFIYVISAFVINSFEHSIANMFFMPAAIMTGADITWMTFFLKNLIPVTIGNIIGGAIFVAIPYYLFHKDEKVQSTVNKIRNL